jgi:hypothetical protein
MTCLYNVHTLWREHSSRVPNVTTSQTSELLAGRLQATQDRDIIRPIAPSSSVGATQSSCRKIRTGAEDLVGRRVPRCALDNLGVQKILAPSKYPLKWPIKFCPQTENNLPHFQNQRYIIIAKQQKDQSVLLNTKEIFEYYVTTKVCKKLYETW